MTAYRVLYYLLDPFTGSRVAIGSLVKLDDVYSFVRCELPRDVSITGASALMISRACDRLAWDASPDRVGDLGPCFTVGPVLYTPLVDDPRAWLSLIGTDNAGARR